MYGPLQQLFQLPEKEFPFISMGTKIFEYNNTNTVCPFKLCQEGLHFILPHMRKRVVHVSKETMMSLLRNSSNYQREEALPDDLKVVFVIVVNS